MEMRIEKKEDLLGGLPENAADSIRDYAEFVRNKYQKRNADEGLEWMIKRV